MASAHIPLEPKLLYRAKLKHVRISLNSNLEKRSKDTYSKIQNKTSDKKGAARNTIINEVHFFIFMVFVLYKIVILILRYQLLTFIVRNTCQL